MSLPTGLMSSPALPAAYAQEFCVQTEWHVGAWFALQLNGTLGVWKSNCVLRRTSSS